jgi:hypothetical protein
MTDTKLPLTKNVPAVWIAVNDASHKRAAEAAAKTGERAGPVANCVHRERGLSARRACTLFRMARAALSEQAARMKELSAQYQRYG